MAHLLLIDDDAAVIPLQVRHAFPAPAHRVEVVTSGAAGLERIGAGPPDVILLDLVLPDRSGLEVYQHIRRIDARIPVIFVTMAETADAAIEAMKHGAYGYLFKPFEHHQLRRMVREAIEVARRQREPAIVAKTAADPNAEGGKAGLSPPIPRAPGEPAAPVSPPRSRLDPEAFLRRRLGPDCRNVYREIHRELDRFVLPHLLEYTGGNQRRAALLLGITRRTLRAKLHELGLHMAHSLKRIEADLL